MPTFVIRDGVFINKIFAEPLNPTHGEAPYVIGDHMEATRHMANNQFYTSKSEFRKATKDAGCVEVGNEMDTILKPRKKIPLDRTKRRNDIRQAVHQLKNK